RAESPCVFDSIAEVPRLTANSIILSTTASGGRVEYAERRYAWSGLVVARRPSVPRASVRPNRHGALYARVPGTTSLTRTRGVMTQGGPASISDVEAVLEDRGLRVISRSRPREAHS